jgi:Spy/CpxP family protein refolding chaperone
MMRLFFIGSLMLSLTACANLQSLSRSKVDDSALALSDAYQQLAEQNHYPSPAMVLAYQDQLLLSDQQAQQSETLLEQQQRYAEPLEQQIKLKTSTLSALLADDSINDDQLAEMLTEISIIKTKLDYLDLSTRVKQVKILNQRQRQHLFSLRNSQSTSP